MFCGSVSGHMLPAYVVYNTCSQLGCSTAQRAPGATGLKVAGLMGHALKTVLKAIFSDTCVTYQARKFWLETIFLVTSASKSWRLQKKLECLLFAFPSNATYLLQPLYVAFFRPLKIDWRKILDSWKSGHRASFHHCWSWKPLCWICCHRHPALLALKL